MEAVQKSEKSWGKTLLLCFFLGLFGAHNFYTGKKKAAIIQLVLTFSYFGIFVTSPWVTIEFFLILFGKYKDANGNLVKR